MDLKIKDVADLLNVSETTIRRWVSEKIIPTYRIDNQYRFNRNEIEDWVLKHKLNKKNHEGTLFKEHSEDKDSKQKGGIKQYSLYRAINNGGVLLNMPGATKEELITGAVKKIAHQLDLDAEMMTELLLERENMMPTALNSGIAVPHTRDFLLKGHHDAVTVVFPAEPIPYGALDGKPVHTLFFLFACQDSRHLNLLAKIAHLSSHPEAHQLLQSKPKKEKLLDYVKNWESNIQQ